MYQLPPTSLCSAGTRVIVTSRPGTFGSYFIIITSTASIVIDLRRIRNIFSEFALITFNLNILPSALKNIDGNKGWRDMKYRCT